jgi:hypothetical protein
MQLPIGVCFRLLFFCSAVLSCLLGRLFRSDVVCRAERQEPFMPVGDTYLHVSNPTLHGFENEYQRGTLTWMA